MPKVSSKSKSSKGGAVQVSRNLQLFFVLTSGMVLAFPIIGLLSMYSFNDAGYGGDYATGFIAITLYPLLLFAITYFYSPAYPTALQRAFIAVIKTLAITSVVTFVTYVKNFIPVLMPTAHDGLTPSWVTSFMLDYVVIALALISTIVFSYFRYRHKHKQYL